MNRITFFSAFALAFALSAGNFIYQIFQADPAFGVAAERSFFQSVAVMMAWIMWREPKEKVQRRGQKPGFCD